MLLFKKKFLEAIRCGEKTQTVRLWTRPRMSAGQRSYIPGVGYIHILAVDPVALAELTDEDARLDGFPTADALRAEIDAIYSQYPDRGQRPYRIRFALAPHETKKPRAPEATSKRPAANRQVPAGVTAKTPPQPARSAPAPNRRGRNRLPLPSEGFPLDQSRSS